MNKKITWFSGLALVIVLSGAGCASRPTAQNTNTNPGMRPGDTPAAVTPRNETPVSASNFNYSIPAAADLYGAWKVSPPAPFASIILERDGNYFTHLNDRPFDEGVWELKDGTLTLISLFSGDEMNRVYSVVKKDERTLYATLSGKETVVWQKTE